MINFYTLIQEQKELIQLILAQMELITITILKQIQKMKAVIKVSFVTYLQIRGCFC